MVLNIEANTSKVRNMDKANSRGLMAAHITESLSKIIFKEEENITGLTVENTMANG